MTFLAAGEARVSASVLRAFPTSPSSRGLGPVAALWLPRSTSTSAQVLVPMSEHYAVRISNDSLVFSAAHFITLAGGVCEEMHGHDFQVAAEVRGPLDENRYVVDFIALQKAIKTVLGELDHRVLLPTEHPLIRVSENEREVEARFEDRRWVLPRRDCALLPIANTTSELLARHVGIRLNQELRTAYDVRHEVIRIEVHESSGQCAICELTAD